MKECDICKRKTNNIYSLYGYKLCSKHMHQLLDHGKFLDNIQRTQNDLNEYKDLEDGTVLVYTYNQRNQISGSFIIDKETVEKIKDKKWRLDNHNRVKTGNGTESNPFIEIGRFILDVTDPSVVVDHIDGNPLNNKLDNLRPCTQRENVKNKSFMSRNTSGAIGVYFDKARNKWAAEIRSDGLSVKLKRWDTLEEAAFARHTAECVLFKEFRNTQADNFKNKLFKQLTQEQKDCIQEYVLKKIQNKLNN